MRVLACLDRVTKTARQIILATVGVLIVAVPASAQTASPLPTGTPVPFMSSGSKLCLTVQGDSSANYAFLSQEACTGRTAQNWSLRASGYADQVLVANAGTGKCLDIANPDKTGDGVRIIQWDCVPQAVQQRWRTVATATGTALVSMISGRCIAVEGAASPNGAPIAQRTCTSAASQSWTPGGASTGTGTGTTAGTGNGTGTTAGTGSGNSGTATGGGATPLPTGSAIPLASAASALCLTVQADATGNGTPLIQYACTGRAAQTWTLRPSGIADQYLVANATTGRCLDINDPSKVSDGARIMQWDCVPQAAQQRWRLTATASGAALVSVISGRCIAVESAGTPAGAPIAQRTCTGASNQSWVVGSSATGTGGGTTPGTGGGTGTSAGTGSGTGASGGTSGSSGTASAGTPPGDTPPSGALALINRQSGMCMQVPGAATPARVVLNQTACTDAANQTWSFVPGGAQGYQVKNTSTGACLWVDGGQTGNNAGLVQQDCGTAMAGGYWQVRKLQDWYEIVALHSGRCTTVWTGSRDEGGVFVQSDCAISDPQRFTLSPKAAPSAWTAPKSLGMTPISGAALPNGKALLWQTNVGGANTMTSLYDPAANTAVNRVVANTGHDMFCVGTNVLPDGRIVVTGGATNSKTSLYDPSTDTWSAGPPMNIQRGYQGATTLSGGEAMVFGGSWNTTITPQGNKFAEVWSPSTSTWRVLSNVNGNAAAAPGVDIFTADNYYWLYAQKDGWVFHAGPTNAMHWIDTRGAGVMTPAGTRGSDPWSINGNAVMYDVGKILKVGGATQYNSGVPALDSAYTIDITAGPGKNATVTPTGSLAMPRAFANSVVLPTGEVVVIGGLNIATAFIDTRAVMMPEIWSPVTGAFRRLAAMQVPRNYHSMAILLTDGRIISGGGGGSGGISDHPDLQILTPPYLYGSSGQLASRPTITAAPTNAALGSTLSITTDRAASSFALVRMSAVTHSTNNDQRRVPLTPTATSGTTYQFALPSDPGVLLPGNWMLFAMDANGVPSVAKVVRIN